MKQMLLMLSLMGAGVLAQAGPKEDLKVLATLESKIVMATDGDVQVVKYKILEDVVDAKTKKVIVPAGAVVVGTISAVDTETGTSMIKFLEVYQGTKKIEVPGLKDMTIGSADGSTGMKGQVFDRNGKYLVGAFNVSFSSAVLGKVSQSVAEKVSERTKDRALQGMAGIQYDLQEVNSELTQNSKIYYVPRGVPAVLTIK